MESRAFKSGEGGSVTWKFKGGDFDFAYDEAPRLVCTNIDLIGARKKWRLRHDHKYLRWISSLRQYLER